jgi:hypothetical protein
VAHFWVYLDSVGEFNRWAAATSIRGSPKPGSQFGPAHPRGAAGISPTESYLGCTRFRDPQSYPDLQVHRYGSAGSFLPQEQVFKTLADVTLLKVSPTIAAMAKTAAFAASDSARMMTGTVLNSSAGAVID